MVAVEMVRPEPQGFRLRFPDHAHISFHFLRIQAILDHLLLLSLLYLTINRWHMILTQYASA